MIRMVTNQCNPKSLTVFFRNNHHEVLCQKGILVICNKLEEYTRNFSKIQKKHSQKSSL